MKGEIGDSNGLKRLSGYEVRRVGCAHQNRSLP